LFILAMYRIYELGKDPNVKEEEQKVRLPDLHLGLSLKHSPCLMMGAEKR